MIRTFEELQELDTKQVVIERPWTGWVTFKVDACTDTHIYFRSISPSGYDFSFNGTLAISAFEHYATQEPIFETKEEAVLYSKERSKNIIDEYVTQYINNKDTFLKEMIQQAYVFQMNPEYGDYDLAMAIKKAADYYYPDLKL